MFKTQYFASIKGKYAAKIGKTIFALSRKIFCVARKNISDYPNETFGVRGQKGDLSAHLRKGKNPHGNE
jgi:hypothetical protein